MSTPILVWGSGAIGGTIGAHLVRAGHEVVFVDLVEPHLASIAAGELAIEGPVSAFKIGAPAFTPNKLNGRFGKVILAVKAQHTADAARQLAPHLTDDGFVVSCQNGLNEPVIAEIVGRERTVGSFVNFGADWLEPGRIMYGGRGAVVVGEMDGALTPRVKELHRAFQDFEPDTLLTDNIFGYLWSKLAWGTVLCAEALTDHTIIDFIRDPALRPLNIALVRQVLLIAQAEGVRPMPFQQFDPEPYLREDQEAIDRDLERTAAARAGSSKLYSGIWRDIVVRKRPTEVGVHLAPVIAAGRRHGLPTSYLERLAERIGMVEKGEQPNSIELATGILDEPAREIPTSNRRSASAAD